MVWRGLGMRHGKVVVACLAFAVCGMSSLQAKEFSSVYTTFDAEKTCKHTPGRDTEDYGS
jgi:hypothetical protein